MCEYCEPMGTATDDYPVFEDMDGSWPVECCEVMCYTANHEVYLVRHGADWYLALVNTNYGTGHAVGVRACPMCGRDLRGDDGCDFMTRALEMGVEVLRDERDS